MSKSLSGVGAAITGYDEGMNVEIWSDVVCRWCYIGKRRFEAALTDFEHGDEVAVRWRSFERDPSAPRLRDGNHTDLLAVKYGMSVARATEAVEQMTGVATAEGR